MPRGKEQTMRNGYAKQKSVLITGATDGLGKALALLLVERGYRVFATGRSPEKLAQLDALAREKELPLESLALDVCSDDSVQRAVTNVLGKAGGTFDVELGAALQRFGIAFRERRGRPVLSAPAVRLALSLFEAIEEDFPRERLIERGREHRRSESAAAAGDPDKGQAAAVP